MLSHNTKVLRDNVLEEERPVQEINLYDLLKHYKSYLIAIIICALIGLGAGFAYNAWIQKPLYKSQATLLLVTTDQSVSTYNTTLINNYIALFKSQSTLQPVINNLHLKQNYQDLAGSLSATNSGTNLVISLSLVNSNSGSATSQLNETLTTFQKEIKQLYGINNIKIVDYASTNNTPYNVHTLLQLALFTAVFTLISLIAIFFHYDYNLNNKKSKKNRKTPKLDNKNLIRLVKKIVPFTKNIVSKIKAELVSYGNNDDTKSKKPINKKKNKSPAKTKKPKKKN